jgi:NAD(P)-dependent dehydrogenase (short-subunit alcohol dehydrogenase family)
MDAAVRGSAVRGRAGIHEDLAGKIVVITGAGTGIGRAAAVAFARQRSTVVVVGRRREPLDEAAAEVTGLGADAVVVACDVADEDGVAALAAEVAALGGADVLVNNAGIGQPRKTRVPDVALDEWNRVLAVNLTGPMLTTKHLASQMIEKGAGAVVNVGSLGGTIPRLGTGAYCASKAGLAHLTRWQALELAPHGVRVNATTPATTVTPMLENGLSRDGIDVNDRVCGSIALYRPRFPLGRVSDVAEQAAPIVFLASAAASFVTGQVLSVDGGVGML